MSVTMAAAVEPIDLEALSLDSFAGRPVAVLGLARSGLSLARFLADRGARVTVYDARPRSELTEAVAALGGRKVELRLGPAVEPADVLRDQALVTTSPSISSRFPTTEPRLRSALGSLEAEGRTPVVSEVDLFLRLCPAATVGVTGTKGKTTTASLAAAVLESGPAPVVLGGNIGIPLVERLPELTPGHRVVLELSELQLPTLSRGTTVAVYTHVTQDHIDRHGSAAAYRAVKRRLAELLPPDGALVLNDEDPVSAAYGDATAARVVRYRRDAVPDRGVGIRDSWVVDGGVAQLASDGEVARRAGGRDEQRPPGRRIVDVARIPLPGEHSRSNVLAAVAVGLLFGVEAEAIAGAVAAFAGVEHRLEPVAEIDGVRFVNDSQGTQPDAVVAALRSFPPPVVLIAGGRDKGVPLDDLAGEAVERAAAVVLIGESAPRLEAALAAAGHRRLQRAPDVAAAVAAADALARELRQGPETATVLLSPAAASFDMFVDYAARGRAFKEAVAALARRRSGA